jgi:hypothetical protein
VIGAGVLPETVAIETDRVLRSLFEGRKSDLSIPEFLRREPMNRPEQTIQRAIVHRHHRRRLERCGSIFVSPPHKQAGHTTAPERDCRPNRMAQSRHPVHDDRCPLLGVKRTLLGFDNYL